MMSYEYQLTKRKRTLSFSQQGEICSHFSSILPNLGLFVLTNELKDIYHFNKYLIYVRLLR